MTRRFLALLMLALLLCGCSSPIPVGQEDPPVDLVYYTIGTPDADLEMVNKALNEILLDRYGFTVEYRKIDWNNYSTHLNAVINTNQQYDVAFSWSDDYLSNALAGNFLNLAPYLAEDHLDLYDAVDPRFWTGATVNNGIYGVPTNKELATPLHFLFSRELAEKYDIDVTKYTTLESLRPLLRIMKQEEPDCIPLFFDSSGAELMSLMGYEYVAGSNTPLMVKADDPDAKICNFFETEAAQSMLNLLHLYYRAGYINQDAPLRTSFSRFPDEKVFCRVSSSGPDSSASFSIDFGYPIVAVQAANAVVTSDSTLGGVMAVNAHTQHPEEAVTFLQAVNTDPDVRNLLNYGIEGVHYTLTENDQVDIISQNYRGAPYTQGNWFILKTSVNERPDKWDIYQEFNEEVISSPVLGFIPDYSSCKTQYDAVNRVYQKYKTPLLTGSVNPSIYLPKFLDELDKAGIDILIQTVQHQVDIWLAAKK